MEQNSQPENTITGIPETKKSKAPLIGMISLGVLAVAGVAFGVVSLINTSNKSAEISDLKAQIAQLTQNTTANNTNQSSNSNSSAQSPNETLSLAEQLAKAYKSKTGKDYAFDNVTSADIKNSTVSPYQTLETYIVIDSGGSYTSSGALFYRTSPNAEWQFFSLTSGGTGLCSEYNTDDLKKAYAGKTCIIEGDATSNGSYSTVQP